MLFIFSSAPMSDSCFAILGLLVACLGSLGLIIIYIGIAFLILLLISGGIATLVEKIKGLLQ